MLVHCFGCTNFGSLPQEPGRSLYLYGPIQILKNRRTVKQDESYKYERMCSQENGRRSGSKAAPQRSWSRCCQRGLSEDDSDSQFKSIVKWTNKNVLEAAELDNKSEPLGL